jgi:hypothetical protein
MGEQQQAENKKQFLRNDSLLVCSMLAVYGVCILGLIGATLWGLDCRSRRISADATSTARAVATQNANATATMVARPTEQAEYGFVDLFDDNSGDWFEESVNDEFMVGSIAIEDGLYAWNIREVKQTFVYWADFRGGKPVEDFDVYVDFKVDDASPDNVCGGFVFRMASAGWEQGAYIFSVCNNSYFSVNYYKQGKWTIISDWRYSNVIQSSDWNRIEISARGDHFTFIINNKVVSEMTDDRHLKGSLALLVEIDETKPATIWFDNFGFQTR